MDDGGDTGDGDDDSVITTFVAVVCNVTIVAISSSVAFD